jgi:molybdenum cofactor cytidylyltransferase
MSDKIGMIILAAGPSSRLGRSKQLLEFNGKALLRISVEIALTVASENTLVVLGYNHEEHKRVIADLPVEIVLNLDWPTGMGSSLKAGISAMQRRSSLKAVIVMVCDQPYISKEHLKKMIDVYRHNDAAIVASKYSSTVGVPVLFHRRKFAAIETIENSQGAKAIIEQNLDNAVLIDFPLGEIDIDTQEDLNRL